MYYPLQIPYLLNRAFQASVQYTEEAVPELEAFVICVWQMEAEAADRPLIENIIVPDACIDLVVDFNTRQIGFSGMSETEFHFTIQPPARFLGARLRPGAFRCMTGLPSTRAMDCFLPLQQVKPDFDTDAFFRLPPEEAGVQFRRCLLSLTAGHTPGEYMRMFDALYTGETPQSAAALYRWLHFSPRQSQRLFLEHFGISPKMALSVMRFQQSIHSLLVGRDSRNAAEGYYDQPHFIRDMKKNIGITPAELLRTVEA